MPEYVNEGSQRVCEAWHDDWKAFFEDVSAHTGLTLVEAMQFHVVTSLLNISHNTRQVAEFVANVKVSPMPPQKEPWEQ